MRSVQGLNGYSLQSSRAFGSLTRGARVTASGYLTGKGAEGVLEWRPQTEGKP